MQQMRIFSSKVLSSKSANTCDLRGAMSEHITIKVKNNVSLKQVAEKLGIKTQSYCTYESGLTIPTVENLLKLSLFFNLSLDDLFEIK